jgi:hypothetical protein
MIRDANVPFVAVPVGEDSREHLAQTLLSTDVTFIGTADVCIHRVAASHGRCACVHTPCCSVTRSVCTCAHTVLQRHTAGVHVYTHRVAASHGRCARAQTPCCSVTRSVCTCAHTVLQRHTVGVHVRTHLLRHLVVGNTHSGGRSHAHGSPRPSASPGSTDAVSASRSAGCCNLTPLARRP